MATIDELKSRDSQDVAYVLVIEGLKYAFCDHPGLIASDWLDGDRFGEGRTLREGLLLPDSYTISVDIRDSGLIEGGHLEVGLIDHDGELVRLFGSSRDNQTLTQIGEPVTPSMHGKDMEALRGWGDSAPPVDARNKDIGIEHIGPDGQRRYWWIFPEKKNQGGWIGLDHPVSDWQPAAPGDWTLPPVFVSDEPYIFAGRKAVIYEVPRNDDGTFPKFLETYEAGRTFWEGTLRDEGRLDGLRTWKLKCDGFGSWLSKSLNTSRPDTGFAITGVRLNLTEEQRGVAVWFWQDTGTNNPENYTYHDAILFVNDFAASDNTPSELAAHVAAQVALARDSGTGSTSPTDTTGGAGNPTDGGAYADESSQSNADRWASFDLNGVSIRRGGASSGFRGVMAIAMHEKAWLTCGWDPRVQPTLPKDNPRRVDFYSGHGFIQTRGHGTINAPGPDYWVGLFSTESLGETVDLDNNGDPRHYRPQYQGGAFFLEAGGGQVIHIGAGPGPYMPGQNGYRPSQQAKI